MTLVQSVEELQKLLLLSKSKAKKIGFVPTMGALHAGHLSLVKKCIEENDVCVVSIFVNPTQFNDATDLEKYPRTLDADRLLLEKEGAQIIFAPSVKEVYPVADNRIFDFGLIDKVMEGKHRPGHFNGVAQVVSRLFDIVKPDRAYFGEKDFQQIAIIKAMVKQLNLEVAIETVPIMRETSGLAMSSRNERLSSEQRKTASLINEVLQKSSTTNLSVEETIDFVTKSINANKDLSVEYFEIVDGGSLQSITNWKDTSYAVGCITVFCGEVRLIDNITYKKI